MGRLRVLEQCMLVVEGLTCRFGTKAAVDNASFAIEPGGFVGVIGRSGAGKSTLLRMINRLAPPTEGRILYKGVDVTALRGKELRQWRVRPGLIVFHRKLAWRDEAVSQKAGRPRSQQTAWVVLPSSLPPPG